MRCGLCGGTGRRETPDGNLQCEQCWGRGVLEEKKASVGQTVIPAAIARAKGQLAEIEAWEAQQPQHALLAACKRALNLRGAANQEGEAFALGRNSATMTRQCDHIEKIIRDAIEQAERP